MRANARASLHMAGFCLLTPARFLRHEARPCRRQDSDNRRNRRNWHIWIIRETRGRMSDRTSSHVWQPSVRNERPSITSIPGWQRTHVIPAGERDRRGLANARARRIPPPRPSRISSICHFVGGATDLRRGGPSSPPGEDPSARKIRRDFERGTELGERFRRGIAPEIDGRFEIVGLTDDLGTFPRSVMFFVAFSFAMRIRCFGAIVLVRSDSLGARVAAGRDAGDETRVPRVPSGHRVRVRPCPSGVRETCNARAPTCPATFADVCAVWHVKLRDGPLPRATLSPPWSTERVPRARARRPPGVLASPRRSSRYSFPSLALRTQGKNNENGKKKRDVKRPSGTGSGWTSYIPRRENFDSRQVLDLDRINRSLSTYDRIRCLLGR